MANSAFSYRVPASSAAQPGLLSLRVRLARRLRHAGLAAWPPLSWTAAILDPIAADGEARRSRASAAALEHTLESLCDDLGHAQARISAAETRANKAASDRRSAMTLVRELQSALHTTRSLWVTANPDIPAEIAILYHRYGLLPSCPDHILDAAEAAQITAWRLTHPSSVPERLADRISDVERDFATIRQHRQSLNLEHNSQPQRQEGIIA